MMTSNPICISHLVYTYFLMSIIIQAFLLYVFTFLLVFIVSFPHFLFLVHNRICFYSLTVNVLCVFHTKFYFSLLSSVKSVRHKTQYFLLMYHFFRFYYSHLPTVSVQFLIFFLVNQFAFATRLIIIIIFSF